MISAQSFAAQRGCGVTFLEIRSPCLGVLCKVPQVTLLGSGLEQIISGSPFQPQPFWDFGICSWQHAPAVHIPAEHPKCRCRAPRCPMLVFFSLPTRQKARCVKGAARREPSLPPLQHHSC